MDKELINKKYCTYYLKKNGKFLYTPLNQYNKLMCVISKKDNLNYLLNFPIINGKDEDDIVNKLLLLYSAQKNDLKYFKLHDKNNIYFFYKENYELALFSLFCYEVKLNKKKYNKLYNKLYGDLLKTLKSQFLIDKIFYPSRKKNILLIRIFYEIYLNNIKELLKLQNIQFDNIANYNELYVILKEKGIIKFYYNQLANKIGKDYNILYNYIIKSKEYKKYIIDHKDIMLSFNDLNIYDIINKNINNNFDKEYIKNKFIELSKLL